MIQLEGVTYDLVVQRDGYGGWLLADSDGTTYGRFGSERRARAALDLMEARLLANGGLRAEARPARRALRETQETQETRTGNA